MNRPVVPVQEDTLDRIASLLDLREPNKNALLSIAHCLATGDGGQVEGVVDVATGVGKTYILVGLIDYLALTAGVRNFVIIVPGRTILRKTIENFTPGARKSLVDKMQVKPVLITMDNFDDAAVREALSDDRKVKVFVFTVQALLEPLAKQKRRIRSYQETLGTGLHQYLVDAQDLVVIADEHHVYFAEASDKFTSAVQTLDYFALIGLTATPHKKSEPNIVYRYPLAHAIADRLVKMPVIVGRSDERTDTETKIRDGLALLGYKDRKLAEYCQQHHHERVNPIMLVVAKDIAQAEEAELLVSSPQFFNGAYKNAVLRIDSSSPDESLADLELVEEPDSPVRIIVSVGMLKEGWDVANVYVIVSLRPSISTILTEQTLGRGLRLPFGQYTGEELLDTLEVIAHEQYSQLLVNEKVLRERLIDYRTRQADAAALRGGPSGGEPAATPAAGGVQPDPTAGGDTPDGEGPGLVMVTEAETPPQVEEGGGVVITSVETRTGQAEKDSQPAPKLLPRADMLPLNVPVVETHSEPRHVSLADVTDMTRFLMLGREYRDHPEDVLRRAVVSAVVQENSEYAKLIMRTAMDRITSQGVLIDPAEVRTYLLSGLLTAKQVPVSAAEEAYAQPIVDRFLEGLGAKATTSIGAYLEQAVASLVTECVKQMEKVVSTTPTFTEVTSLRSLAPERTGRPETSEGLLGPFKRGVGYLGFTKSLYTQDWFDSKPERDAANLLDVPNNGVALWLRLQRGDLPVLWRFSTGNQDSWYNPDFLLREDDGTWWVLEVKMGKEMASGDVQGKKSAAERWASRVSGSELVQAKWKYLLVSETQVAQAQDDWKRLKGLYSGR